MIKFFKFIPFQLTFFLVIGILIGNHFQFKPLVITQYLVVSVFIFGVVYFFKDRNQRGTYLFNVFFFITTMCIGVATITFSDAKNNVAYFGNKVELDAATSHLIHFRITKILKSTRFYQKFEAEVIQLDSFKTTGKILVNLPKDTIKTKVEIDEVLLTNTLLKPIPVPINPYAFNYKKYLAHQQIYYQLNLSQNQYKKLETKKTSINGIAFFIRKKINKSLQKNGLINDELAVVNALLLGQRNAVSSELLKSYAGAGAIHILAVSGLHIGILLFLLTWLLKPLRYLKNGKVYKLILIVILLWLYAILAGLSASVVRAVAMFTAIAVSLNVKRISNIYNILVISMFFLLLFHPFYLFDVGFQLSYLAVFAIVWLQPKLYKLLSPTTWFLDKLWQLFTVSMAAQIGILPLSIYYFHQFPGLFFVANLIIIPFLGMILLVGIVVILLAVFHILPNFVADFYSLIIHIMNSIVVFIANQQSFLIQNISISLTVMLSSYLFILLFFKFLETKKAKRLILVLLSLIFIQTVFIYEKYSLQTSKAFIVFHKTKSSIIGIRNGDGLKIYTSEKQFNKNLNPLKDYLIGVGVKKNKILTQQSRLYQFKNKLFLSIDSLGIYPSKFKKPVAIILQKSPKINLERLLTTMHSTEIIADGSNYKNDIVKWKKTCLKYKTPFYSTMQKGAYKLVD